MVEDSQKQGRRSIQIMYFTFRFFTNNLHSTRLINKSLDRAVSSVGAVASCMQWASSVEVYGEG